MLSLEQINALGNILNTTYGKASSKGGDRSVTGSLEGDTLTLKFLSVVQFASEQSLREQTDRMSEESVKVLADMVKNVKKEFKESVGSTLKLKEENSTDNVEIVAGSVHAPRKLAYYRRVHTLKIKE